MLAHKVQALGLLLGVLAIGLGPIPQSSADNATSSLAVTAIVPPVVDVDTGPVNDINYDFSSGSSAQSQITVTASVGMVLNIRMGQGLNPGSGSSDDNPVRRMKSSQNNFLNYQLTQDANHTDNWGNTESTGVTLTGTGTQQTVNFYVFISPDQNAPVGNYTDTIQMTTDY